MDLLTKEVASSYHKPSETTMATISFMLCLHQLCERYDSHSCHSRQALVVMTITRRNEIESFNITGNSVNSSHLSTATGRRTLKSPLSHLTSALHSTPALSHLLTKKIQCYLPYSELSTCYMLSHTFTSTEQNTKVTLKHFSPKRKHFIPLQLICHTFKIVSFFFFFLSSDNVIIVFQSWSCGFYSDNTCYTYNIVGDWKFEWEISTFFIRRKCSIISHVFQSYFLNLC